MERTNHMTVQRVFGCGIDSNVFRARYESLRAEDQYRLERVAARVTFARRLRYEMAVMRNPFQGPYEDFELAEIELPALEVYLLFTCIDTLAGQATYLDFRDWLTTRVHPDSMSTTDVTALYELYQDQFGVGRNIRGVFAALPEAVTTWLANNVMIREAGEPLTVPAPDLPLLLRRLYGYFYDIRRNQFTHSSSPQQVLRASPIDMSGQSDRWVTPASGTLFVLDKRRPEKKFNFSLREGLDESLILHVIIIASGLRILGIALDMPLLEKNLRKVARLDALHSFMAEADYNARLLQVWSTVEEKANLEFRTYVTYGAVPTLQTSATARVIEQFDNSLPLEAGMQQIASFYLGQIEQINSRVIGFNERTAVAKAGGKGAEERWTAVRDFLVMQTGIPGLTDLIHWPGRVEMTNLWLIIRDPCYT